MSSFVNQINVTDDSKIINTLNHHTIYPYMEMFIKSKKGINLFEKIVAGKLFFHLIICFLTFISLDIIFNLSNQKPHNIYILGIFSTLYMFFQTLRMIHNKHEIMVKALFHRISYLGEKETLIYFLATLRKSSFVGNREYLNSALDNRNYRIISEQFSRIFEIINKENLIYRPTTPTENLIPLK